MFGKYRFLWISGFLGVAALLLFMSTSADNAYAQGGTPAATAAADSKCH